MKKNLVRLLSVILTVVMVFPAAVFAAEGEAIPLYTGDSYTIQIPEQYAEMEMNWRSMQEDVKRLRTSE